MKKISLDKAALRRVLSYIKEQSVAVDMKQVRPIVLDENRADGTLAHRGPLRDGAAGCAGISAEALHEAWLFGYAEHIRIGGVWRLCLTDMGRQEMQRGRKSSGKAGKVV